MKKLTILLFVVILTLAAAAAVWCVSYSLKPKLLANVKVTSEVLTICNGNETAWRNATITINDAFSGPTLVVIGSWPPNEIRDLPLTKFKGRLNQQPFKPDFEKVLEVIIDVEGFQLATRK